MKFFCFRRPSMISVVAGNFLLIKVHCWWQLNNITADYFFCVKVRFLITFLFEKVTVDDFSFRKIIIDDFSIEHVSVDGFSLWKYNRQWLFYCKISSLMSFLFANVFVDDFSIEHVSVDDFSLWKYNLRWLFYWKI